MSTTIPRHPDLGYSTKTGIYLGSAHLRVLVDAARGDRRRIEFDSDAVRDLRDAALIDSHYRITPAGRWHLKDRGRL